MTKLLTDPRGERVMDVFDRYGSQLHLVASILTDEPQLAERAVVQAVAAHHRGPCTLRELSAAVYIAWAAWGPHDPTTMSHPLGTSAPESQLFELHGLSDDQRAAVALCRFGGHSYRQAAEVLDLPAEHVAGLLCTALRRLAVPRSAVPARTA